MNFAQGFKDPNNPFYGTDIGLKEEAIEHDEDDDEEEEDEQDYKHEDDDEEDDEEDEEDQEFNKPKSKPTLNVSKKSTGLSSSDLKTTTPMMTTPQTPSVFQMGSGETEETAFDTQDMKPKLQNVVSTVNLGVPLDLKKIAQHARNAEYNPKRFAAVIMRIRDPKTTALIFSSGKMVCTGAKSEDDSKLAARRYARIVQKIGFEVKFLEFKIQNIVGSVDVGFNIRLENLQTDHSRFSTYEPELFPGLIYRMISPKIVLLIFVSGKMVLTGAKVREEIYDAFDNILPILLNYKVTN